jgi:hypothetical protein
VNLAVEDIRHNVGRFALTATGIGLLLMLVLGMGGIYGGLVHEATLLIDRLEADLWVVQHGTRGPFAEISRVPATLAPRLEASRVSPPRGASFSTPCNANAPASRGVFLSWASIGPAIAAKRSRSSRAVRSPKPASNSSPTARSASRSVKKSASAKTPTPLSASRAA